MIDKNLLMLCGEAFLRSDDKGRDLAMGQLCQIAGIMESQSPESYEEARKMLHLFRSFLVQEDQKRFLDLDVNLLVNGATFHWDCDSALFLNTMVVMKKRALGIYYKNPKIELDISLQKGREDWVLSERGRTDLGVYRKCFYLDRNKYRG